MTRKSLEYALRYTDDPKRRDLLEKALQKFRMKYDAFYHISAFQHPVLPCITENGNLEGMYWGLIPNWIHSDQEAKEIWNKTLNARSETMFEKPAYRMPAANQRCIVVIDSYFEYFNYGGKAYPFNISLKSNEPMLLAGLYDDYISQKGNKVRTVSIVTTLANEVLSQIHQNKHLKEGRMPLVLNGGEVTEWLNHNASESDIMKIALPKSSELFRIKSVGVLKGKTGIGNHPDAVKPQIYPELSLLLDFINEE